MRFVPRRGSLGVEIASAADPTTGLPGNHLAATNVAYLFFPAGAGRNADTNDPASPSGAANALRAPARATHFTLRANPGCGDGDDLHAPGGGGSRGLVGVRSPRSRASRPVDRWMSRSGSGRPPAPLRASTRTSPSTCTRPSRRRPGRRTPSCRSMPRLAFHEQLVGSIQVFGKVVGDPGSIGLTCSSPAAAGGLLAVAGRIEPAPASSQVLLEYRRGREPVDARFVTTDAAGPSATASRRLDAAPWQVRAFWPGDADARARGVGRVPRPRPEPRSRVRQRERARSAGTDDSLFAAGRSTIVGGVARDGGAFSEAFEASYDELRRLARRQLRRLRPGETLATTALVNEAFLKLVQGSGEGGGQDTFLRAGRSCDASDPRGLRAAAGRREARLGVRADDAR